ncbi:MAG: DUF5317 domain-containing protein [Armatimonadota bacterium]
MIIEAFILSILVGFVRRGKLQNLGRAPVRHVWLFGVAFLIMAAVETLGVSRHGGPLRSVIRSANIVQYVILLAAILANFHMREMWLAGFGTFLNALVVAVNGGTMPVSARALRVAGYEEMLRPEVVSKFVRHSIMSSSTHLKLIADIIPIPKVLILPPQVLSIGDALVAVAVFIFVQRYMVSSGKTC